MTATLSIYVSADLSINGTFDSGNAHLARVMWLLDMLGVIHLHNKPVTPMRGKSVAYTITPWGRELVWKRSENKRGYMVFIPIEDY